MHGRGTLRYHTGDVYVGDFFYNFEQGLGILELSSGDSYEGEFFKGKR